jgi:steroid delta-isomerase-like uncharacterized protein
LIRRQPETPKTGEDSMSNSHHADTIRRFYEECLNQGNLDALPALVSENVVSHSSLGDQVGLTAFTQGTARVRSLFPGGRFVVDDVVSEGDRAAARWTMNGTHSTPVAGVAPTGKPLVQRANVLYRFEDGKIAELWVQLDMVSLLRQLGVEIPGLPTPSPAAARA